MRALSIKFLALPSSKNIEQDYGQRLCTVSIKEQANAHPEGLVITGVFVDGMPQWSVPIDPHTVAIRPPLKQQGERVEVRCLIPEEQPAKAPQTNQAPTPPPDLGYGLQAPAGPRQRHLQ